MSVFRFEIVCEFHADEIGQLVLKFAEAGADVADAVEVLVTEPDGVACLHPVAIGLNLDHCCAFQGFL